MEASMKHVCRYDGSSGEFSTWCDTGYNWLARVDPLLLVGASLVAGMLIPSITSALSSLFASVQEEGLRSFFMKSVIMTLRKLPGIRGYIEKEQNKVVEKLNANGNSERGCWLLELPRGGLGTSALDRLRFEKSRDKDWQGKCSGTVYIDGSETDSHFSLINSAYSLFSHTNALHFDVFPSIVKLEAEVVAMTASLLGAKDLAAGGKICGNMTSGGTESILMAVKTARDFMKATKGITKPEMIIAESAHSAYDKAAHYFQIKLRRTPVDKDLKADVESFKHQVNKNTILIVGSAPGFPHGIIDPIEELGAFAQRRGICFHVDLCLGGFVLPFAHKLGYAIPPFDFKVPGVTSISADVHKYGLAPKGTSIVLYRSRKLRQHQFVAVTEWSGGLYVSPSMAGSRAGGLIAGAWAAMMSVGEEGYLEATKKLMETSKSIIKGISAISGLFVLGKPDMTVIAFGSHELDIFKVNDVMTKKGWTLSPLQKPSSLHICVTLQHVGVADQFLYDLSTSVAMVQKNPGDFEDGLAPVYGAAAKMPDRGAIQDFLVAYMDSRC
ncbi:hypothetical protein O6H91_03G119900 [Diphasiastrum complanatum]|uniref:Uncharacterized protein n=1 Tax=Diphasiastrum complanatum TaxID=34168 RepID=A0ACC2EB27_DIPCM|nr:hypothetical protein O6H91_03G119900 [Diphasiastrum complanatum]